MDLEIWDILPNEQLYTYSQPTSIESRCGLIGHLRADMDTDGNGFFTTWDDHNTELKTQAFKDEFDEVIRALRFDPEYDGILKDRKALARYCYSHPSCQMADGRSFGIRVDTEQYSYLCRLNPNKGEYNAYIYAYKREWLDQHLSEAQKGVRFIDPRYHEVFRVPDGGKIRIRRKDGSSAERVCRYIDDYHAEIGGNLYHICEFAEQMEYQGNTVEPVGQPLLKPGREHREYEGTSR